MQYGVQISALNDFSSSSCSVVDRIDSECMFRLKMPSLLPSTTYYYRPYVRMNGVYGYGDVKSFTTAGLVAPFLDPVSDITDRSVMVSGQVFLASGVSEDMKYGVQISSSASFKKDVYDMTVTDIDADCRFAMRKSMLRPFTTYYYRPYIRMNAVYCYGPVKTFTTAALDMSKVMDLSSAGTANCYIVSETGRFAFKAVKGNSPISAGTVAGASVLWESFGTSEAPDRGDLISDVYPYNGFIVFDVLGGYEGNAVIAAHDVNGNILWSWHIWLTDQPQGQVYYNGAGTMMDRNLGATSPYGGYGSSLGLLYQWGRKDPFLGSYSIDSNNAAASTLSWPSDESSSSSVGTIEYAVAHPTTFITGTYSSGNRWHYSSDNSLWTTSSYKKSVYDPCPAGWRVPDGGSDGIWSKARGNSYEFRRDYDDYAEGMYFGDVLGDEYYLWYPAAGFLSYDYGSMKSVGEGGYYWSATTYSGSSAYNFCLKNYSYSDNVYPSDHNYKAYGFSVRCVKE